MKKKTKDDGSTYWELTTEEDIPSMMPPLPFPEPEYRRNSQQQVFYIVGNGKNLREGLTEVLLAKREAQFRFKDASLEGLLKGALAKDAIEEMNLNPEERYPYLEAQVNDAVSTGRYLKTYQSGKKQAMQGKPVKISTLLPELGWMQKHVPEKQYSLYSKTGFYVREGSVYAGMQERPVENLMQYVRKAA